MENNKKKSSLSAGHIVVLIVIAVLNILWLICRIIRFSGTITLQTGLPILVFLLTAVYVLFAYKKPHGNLLRYLLLVHVVSEGILLIANQSLQPIYLNVVNLAVIILTTYMAGRLSKYRQNVVISIVILILQIVNVYYSVTWAGQYGFLTFSVFFSQLWPVTIWLAVAASYILRYHDHKEAALADK